MVIEFQWSLVTENSEQKMPIESLVRKKYFLTSEQNVMFCDLSIERAKYVVQEVFLICF
jgi:hypothetical protein